ncbi:MAG: hypothetical protein JKY54_15690 [Flavobacteriales bacterium]|nr:hypothetical protein [Flavobacteriales bacterium]
MLVSSTLVLADDITCSLNQIASDGEEFRGIGGSSDSNVIAVGHGTPASFYHYDGSSWTKHADSSDKQLHDVSVLSTNLAYAVGHDGRIMQYDGTNWTNFSSPTTEYITSLWALSDSDIWIAGKENTLYQWDGTNWTDMSVGALANIDSTEELSDIWGDSSSVFTVEKDGDLYRQTKSSDSWDKFTACNTAYDMEAKSLWSDGSGNVYIAGKDKGPNPDEASVFLYNEGSNSCTKVFSTSTGDKFEGIYGSGSVVYAAGKKGLVANNSSGSWVESTQGSSDYKAVWVSDSDTAYTSGKNGYVLSCSGVDSPSIDPPVESCAISQIASDGEEFRGIGGSSDSNVIAVGHGKPASFYHYDGSSWTKHADSSDKQLHDVSVVSTSLAYAVAHDGRIMQYDGTNWSIFASPSTKYLTSVWAESSSDIWIVGKENTLYHWDGATWTDMSGAGQANVDSGQELSSSWAGSTRFYALEKDGDLYRYTQNSGTWDKFGACNTDFNLEAKALWSDGAGNVYIAGKDKDSNEASVWFYDENSNSCSNVFSTSTQDKFEGLYGSDSVVYAAGKKGLIATNSSGTWVESTQASVDLKAVWVSDSGKAYFAGKTGFATDCSAGSSPPSSSCRTIPSDYALYSASSINLTQKIKVNGQTISSGSYSPEAAIDKNGNVTTNANLTLPALDPATFPTNSETHDEISSSDITINETSEAYYDDIKLTTKNTTVTFTGGGTLHIDKLETQKEGSIINFASGTYYINELKVKKEDSVINITSEPVIIHIGTKFEIEKQNVDVNKNGDIDDFIVYLHSGSKFKAKKENLDFTGIIYGPDASEVKFEKKGVNFHGFIAIGGGEIKVMQENFSLTYTDDDIAAVNALGSCDSAFDHFELSYAANGLTCLPSSITLKACRNTDCSALYTEDINVTLDPATGWVSNPVTISSGTASLDLQHTTAEDVIVDITASSITPTGVLQCFAGSDADATCTLNFAEAGFVFDIPTQTACKPSVDVTIAAVKKSNITDQCVGALTGTQSVNFWSTYSSPITGTKAVSISGTAIDTSSPGTSVDLDFDLYGEATFTVQYDDAGQVQIDAEHTTASDLVLTGNDQFVSTPVMLTVYTDDNNYECVSGDASCSRFKKAGERFNLNVNAACWEDDADTDFSDNPVTPNFELNSIAVIPSLVAPSGGSNGSLDVASFNFSTSDNGNHVISQAISEVGVFTFGLSPPSYFGETLTTVSSDNIGRFYPDHFEVSSQLDGDFGYNSCGTFTYSGQNFSYTTNPQLTITAYNAANTAAVTQNYRGDFIKLVASNFALTGPTTDAVQLGTDNTNLVQLDWTAAVAPLTDNSNGSVTFTSGNDTYKYEHVANSRIAPFTNAADLVFSQIKDSDDVLTQGLPISLRSSGEPIRFGRLTINNAHGSELLPLPVTIQAEFFNGANWQQNTADQCTVLNKVTHLEFTNNETSGGSFTSTMNIGAGTTTPTLSNNNPMVSGDSIITFSAPGENNQGYVDIQSQLAANYDWLLGDFDNDGGYDDEASSRASFGLFKGTDNIIFRLETY